MRITILLAAIFLTGCENRPDEVPDEAFTIDLGGDTAWVWCTKGRDGPPADCALFLDEKPGVTLHRVGQNGHWVEEHFETPPADVDGEAPATAEPVRQDPAWDRDMREHAVCVQELGYPISFLLKDGAIWTRRPDFDGPDHLGCIDDDTYCEGWIPLSELCKERARAAK